MVNSQVNQNTYNQLSRYKTLEPNNTFNTNGLASNGKRIDSTPSMQGFSLNLNADPVSTLNKNLNDDKRKKNNEENSFTNSQKSKDSTNSIINPNVGYRLNNFPNDFDVLSKEIDHYSVNKLPINLKLNSQNRSQLSSSSSLNRELSLNKNSVDKYFTDINGNSLISTLSPSNDLFSNLSSSNFSKRTSLLSGNKTNRGINAANQILFGNHAAIMPAFHNSQRQESFDRFSYDTFSQSKYSIRKL